MTDDEYSRLLQALAAKHLAVKGRRRDPHFLSHENLWQENERIRGDLQACSEAARLLKVFQDQPGELESYLIPVLKAKLTQNPPIQLAQRALIETGLLEALEEAGPVVFKELRRGSIPAEDAQLLRNSGYTDDEIEILFALAIDKAHQLSAGNLTDLLSEADRTLKESLKRLGIVAPKVKSPPKKRKLFNGIGKILGGSIAGIGNALMATGTILAPNPATAAGAIASAAVAVPAILAGVGDLRGE